MQAVQFFELPSWHSCGAKIDTQAYSRVLYGYYIFITQEGMLYDHGRQEVVKKGEQVVIVCLYFR